MRLEGQIRRRQVPAKAGCAAPLDSAVTAFRSEFPEREPTFPDCRHWQTVAFSFAGAHHLTVRNPDFGIGFEGALTISPPQAGSAKQLAATLEFSVHNDPRVFAMKGLARLENRSLRLQLATSGQEKLRSFEGLVHHAPGLGLFGDILFQQDPNDPCFNGDADLVPADGESENTVFAIVKIPRLDDNGDPIFEGEGPHREQVFDCYFWRGGRWWRIRDPDLRLPGEPDLIDLRDGSENPNYEPADEEATERLDREIFPTGWDDFWEGFDEATARQLQGLAVTMSVMNGVDLDLWRKIQRLRNEGKSWEEIWNECAWDIMAALGYSLLAASVLGRILGKLFGPFVRRMRRRLRRGDRPPTGTINDHLETLRQWLRELLAERDQLNRRLRDLNRSGNRSRMSDRHRRAERRRISERIGEINEAIEDIRRAMDQLGH